jgi:hypothetical protein|nr:hypothetical protein [Kofleriaceae bacterium]
MGQGRGTRPLVLALLAGCIYVPPASFSSGSRWTFPLVDPLRDSKLIVPVTVDGRGPYLFALDPDAKQTTVDRDVITDNWGEPLKPTVDLANLVIGDLTVSELLGVAVADKNGKLDSDGRHIAGVIGRDVITDQLAFGFDRERGIAWLQRFDEFKPGAALPLKYDSQHGDRVVTAQIGGTPVTLAIELGDVASELRRARWDACKLAPRPMVGELVDHLGVRRDVTELGIASSVQAGPLRRDGLGFIDFEAASRSDGTLGLDFFRPFVVTLAEQHKTVYVTSRQASPDNDKARLNRWGTQMLDACKAKGCVTVDVRRVELDDGSERVQSTPRLVWLAGLTTGPSERFVFQATRDPAATGNDLQVVLDARGADGGELPRLEVDLPAGVDTAAAPADARYLDAALAVVDVSPFPRSCPGRAAGCVVREPSAAP